MTKCEFGFTETKLHSTNVDCSPKEGESDHEAFERAREEAAKILGVPVGQVRHIRDLDGKPGGTP